MSKTQTTIRLEESDYKEAKEILKYLGMSYSQAVNMFNRMIVLERGLPFDAKIPNEETLKAMKEALELEGEYITLDDMKRDHESLSD
jgi:DNA-damage-inducible protein J